MSHSEPAAVSDPARAETDVSWRGPFNELNEGFFIAEMVRDPDRRVIDWRVIDMNAAWERSSSLAGDESRKRTVREAIPGIEPVWMEKFADVANTGMPASFSHVLAALERSYDVRVFPVDSERVAVSFVEATGRQLADRRRDALLQLSATMGDLRDPDEIAYATAEALARVLNVSRAGYGEVDLGSETITIARDWNAPGITSLAGVLNFRDYGTYVENLKRGETVVVVDAYQDPRTRDMAEALNGISAVSFVNMPVSEQGGFVALLYLNNGVAREWSADELYFIREAAERTRQAVERRRAEHSLRRLAASLEEVVEIRTRERDRVWRNAQDLIVIIDGDGTFKQVNPAVTRVLGWAPEQMIGRNVLDFVVVEDGGFTEDALAQATHTRLPAFANRYRHLDGSVRWISWVTSPEEGLVFAYGRDITAEKVQAEALQRAQAQREHAEEQLRQAQKMEAVGQLTGGLAHDFNNLLTGISGSLEMLQSRVAQGKLSAIERYLSAAQGAAKRAAALTHRLLAFSRRQTLDPKSTDVNRLVADMAEMIRRTVGPATHFDVVGAGGLWPTLVDPNQLENSLLNLCINARDAMPNGGRITIETANKWLDERAAAERDLPPGQYVSLCVTDTGTGMTPDVVARAFDPFFTTKPLGEGTGLGLSMVYGFARQSGGQVRIYTELGQGTTVCLYLPRDRAGPASETLQDRDAEGDLQGAGEVVLVIDDEPTIRMLVTEILEDFGYASIEAADGPTGLKVLQSKAKIDLLITDVGLPGGINGRQVADAARLLRPGLKVLFITGYAENAVVGNGHLDPGMQVLTKPFAMDALAKRIKSLVEG